jgi:hypothetical protein
LFTQVLNRTIEHNAICAARMLTKNLFKWTAIIFGPWASRRSILWGLIIVDQFGYSEGTIWITPPPNPTFLAVNWINIDMIGLH